MNKDHIKHFVICAIATLGSFGFMATFFPFAPSVASCWLLPIGLGVGKEYGDSQASGNRWDWTDILADVFGILAAVATLFILRIISECFGA